MREEDNPDPLWWLRGLVYVICQGAVDLWDEVRRVCRRANQ